MRKLSGALVALCTLGLMACGTNGSPTNNNPQIEGEKVTLQLNRTEDGLEYCDEATGECFDLPYDGQCVIVEVDIDPVTGATCERCITEDGESIDLGCTDTSVGCVVVTLPEPDCVVCAYVNGDIIFSSCIADEEEPECESDADCINEWGQYGFCFEGQCVFEEGCIDDSDCPPGFACIMPPIDFESDPMPGTCVPDRPDPCDGFQCGEGSHCEVLCYGNDAPPADGNSDPTEPPCMGDDCWGGCEPTCVPDPTTCTSDADCAEGEVCESWCDDVGVDCPPGADCMPPECDGICVPYIPDPCDDLQCAEGQHCEVYCYGDGGTTPGDDNGDAAMPCPEDDYNCGCEAVCVDDPSTCQSDTDCAEGEVCEMWCYDEPYDCMPDDPNCMPPPCEGICVPYWDEYCYSDADCPAGMICEFYDYPTDPTDPTDPDDPNGDGLWAEGGVCVPYTPNLCDTVDCADGQHCEVYCTGVDDPTFPCEPNDPWCGCEAVCVDDPATCQSDADCGDGEICDLWCYDVPVDCLPGQNCETQEYCEGVCIPDIPEPCDDVQCEDGQHCEVYCTGAWDPTLCEPDDYWCGCEAVCVDDPTTCQSDEDCGEGEMCEMWCYDEPYDCMPDDPNCMPPPCEGMCVPAVTYCYSDEECPDGQVCDIYDYGMPCDPDNPDCDSWVPGVCVDNGTTPFECQTDADCGDGFCVDGLCADGGGQTP